MATARPGAGRDWLLSARRWFTGPVAQGDETKLQSIEAESGHLDQKLAVLD